MVCGRNHDLSCAPARNGVSVEGHIVAQCLLNVRQALWRYISARDWNNISMVDKVSISHFGSVAFVGCDASESPRKKKKTVLTSGSASLANN